MCTPGLPECTSGSDFWAVKMLKELGKQLLIRELSLGLRSSGHLAVNAKMHSCQSAR